MILDHHHGFRGKLQVVMGIGCRPSGKGHGVSGGQGLVIQRAAISQIFAFVRSWPWPSRFPVVMSDPHPRTWNW